MANIEELNEEALEGAVGGAQSSNPNGPHYHPLDHRPGEEWGMDYHTWYVIKPGDTLAKIAADYRTTIAAIKALNPQTITNINEIYVGDAIKVL